MSKAKKKGKQQKSNSQIYYEELEDEFKSTSIQEKFSTEAPIKPAKPNPKELDENSPVAQFYKKTFSKTPEEEIMREYAERMFLKKGVDKDGTNN